MSDSTEQAAVSSQENAIPRITIGDLLLLVARNVRLVIILPAIFAVITVVYLLFFAEEIYTSNGQLIAASQTSTSRLTELASQFGVSTGGGRGLDFTSAELYPAIIKSRTLSERLLNRRFLYGDEPDSLTLLELILPPKKLERLERDALITIGTKRLINDIISANRDPETSILTIKVSTNNAKLSADLAKAVIEELDQIQKEHRMRSVDEKARHINERLDSLSVQLSNAETRLTEFRERNKSIQGSPALMLEQERLLREVQVLSGVFLTLKQQQELTQLEAIERSSMLTVIDLPEKPLEPSQPQKFSTLMVSIFLGVILALGIIFVKAFYLQLPGDERGKISEGVKFVVTNLNLRKGK